MIKKDVSDNVRKLYFYFAYELEYQIAADMIKYGRTQKNRNVKKFEKAVKQILRDAKEIAISPSGALAGCVYLKDEIGKYFEDSEYRTAKFEVIDGLRNRIINDIEYVKDINAMLDCLQRIKGYIGIGFKGKGYERFINQTAYDSLNQWIDEKIEALNSKLTKDNFSFDLNVYGFFFYGNAGEGVVDENNDFLCNGISKIINLTREAKGIEIGNKVFLFYAATNYQRIEGYYLINEKAIELRCSSEDNYNKMESYIITSKKDKLPKCIRHIKDIRRTVYNSLFYILYNCYYEM